MANVKITDLTAYTNPVSTDVLPIVDVGADVTKKISIADLLENAGSGTAAAPGIAFDGDSNTGIYRPGADQVAISTNGTGRLFVDASGNVGIGTAPGAQLDILSSGFSNLRVRSSATNSATINLTNSARNYSFNTNSGDFYIRDESAVAERLRITSAGLVGIGTSSPAYQLDIETTSGSTLSLNRNKTDLSDLDFIGGLRFGNNDANGSPPHGTGIKVVARDEFGAAKMHFLSGNRNSWDDDTYAMTIDDEGRVGIGTTAPAAQLHVVTSGAGSIRFADGTRAAELGSTGTVCYAGSITSGQDFALYSANAERARIDSSGRLLVGTSTSADLGSSMQTAQTSGTGAFEAFQFSNSAAYPYITFAKSRGASVGTNAIVQNGDPLGQIVFRGANGTGYNTAASITASVDAVPGASNDMPGRLVFSTTADGASTPTERVRINKSGAQQSFSENDVYRAATAQGAGTSFGFYYGYHSATTTQNGTLAYLVYTNGNVVNANNSYGATSDIKLKENIVDANSQWDDIKALQVRNYNFKEGQTHTQIGLVAQEVELVSPGLVSESPDRDEDGNDLGTVTKSVNYSVLYMKAVKALQEAMERIETLEQRLNDAGIN